MFKANAIEIEWPQDTIIVTCDDGKSYKLRIKDEFVKVDRELDRQVIDDWFQMIVETKCKSELLQYKGVLK